MRKLLASGKVDATGSNDDPGNSPLRIAARRDDLELCRTLVLEGRANPGDVIDIDVETRHPFFHNTVEPEAFVTSGRREELLEGLLRYYIPEVTLTVEE